MNKYTFLAFFGVVIFWVLLFTDFAHASIYHMLFTSGIALLSLLPGLLDHIKKRPDLAHLRLVGIALMVGGYLIIAIFGIVLTEFPPNDPTSITNISLWGTSGIVLLICAAKLAFKWHRLSVLFRITVILAMISILVSLFMPGFLNE